VALKQALTLTLTLVALKQAFVIERQIGTDGARLCAACLGTVHALEALRRPAVRVPS